MRAIVIVKPPKGTNVASMHARYISERERNPNCEEPVGRPIFTHELDGLRYTAADRYLAGGVTARAKPRDLMHLIISFNSYDQKQLKKLEGVVEDDCPKIDPLAAETKKDKKSKIDPRSKIDLAEILKAQVARDKPYAQAVRQMMRNLEERTGRSDFRYALTVHRHTSQTHVHLILRREHTDKTTGERICFEEKALPREFVNGRDERGRARGGLIDQALSDSLDTMFPQRKRSLPQSPGAQVVERDKSAREKTDQFLTPPEDLPKRDQIQGQNLDNRYSHTQPSKRKDQTNEVRNEPSHDVKATASSPRFALTPRFSRIRTSPGTEVSGSQQDVSQNHASNLTPSPESTVGQKLTSPKTDQILTSADQQLDQKLTYERFSKVPKTTSIEGSKNNFSDPITTPIQPVRQSSPVEGIYSPVKEFVKLERPELVPLIEKQKNSPTRTR